MKDSTRLIITYSLIPLVGFSTGYYSDQYPLQSFIFCILGITIISYWSWSYMHGKTTR